MIFREALDIAMKYRYHTVWSPEDGAFIATCSEWPFLSWVHSTPVNALHSLFKLITDEVLRRQSTGEFVPKPGDQWVQLGAINDIQRNRRPEVSPQVK